MSATKTASSGWRVHFSVLQDQSTLFDVFVVLPTWLVENCKETVLVTSFNSSVKSDKMIVVSYLPVYVDGQV